MLQLRMGQMQACLQQKYLYAIRSPSSRHFQTRPQGGVGVGRESLSETGVSKASIHSSTTAHYRAATLLRRGSMSLDLSMQVQQAGSSNPGCSALVEAW